MKLVVGLGNHGKEYEGTRHSVGFVVVDALAERAGLKWKKDFKGEVAKGAGVAFFKPMTYMNLSGDAVIEAAQFYKIDTKADLVVVHDELDLPLGTVRVSVSASAGGHNGVKSLIERLGHRDFVRVRIGIGRPTDRTPVDEYVLQPFRAEEREAATDAEKRAAEAAIIVIKEGPDAAMNRHNG